jgi:hypothetical protein
VEIAAGMIAKKLVEHAGFCYFEAIQEVEQWEEGSKE